MKNHGGAKTVYSEAGMGSTFNIFSFVWKAAWIGKLLPLYMARREKTGYFW
jgi:hypothetical protein